MSKNSKLWVYSRLDFLKKYNLKFLFIAFIGIHIPLIGIIAYLLYADHDKITPLGIGLLTLVLTLLATTITLIVLHELLRPMQLMQKGLEEYSQNKKLPDLPTHYQDEVGQVMAKLQYTLAQFKNLLDEKQDLIALLSHDLRSPVNQIRGLIAIVEDPSLEEALRQEYLQAMDDLCNRHASLLSEVLYLLRNEQIEADESLLEETEVLSFLEECIQELQLSMEKKGVTVQLTTALKKVYVPINRTFFQQALRNLLENALKFSFPQGKIEVLIDTTLSHLQIKVKDYGMGFQPELAPQLFEKFTKQGRKGTLNEPSTGLGLHLTKKIIEQHGGYIEARSEGPETGATFTIRLSQWKAERSTQVLPSVSR